MYDTGSHFKTGIVRNHLDILHLPDWKCFSAQSIAVRHKFIYWTQCFAIPECEVHICVSVKSPISVNNLMTVLGSLIVFMLHALQKPHLSDLRRETKACFLCLNSSTIHLNALRDNCLLCGQSQPERLISALFWKCGVWVTLPRVKMFGVCFWDFQGI